MKRAWTRGEKMLWAAPILFGIVALAAKFGPDVARRAMGYPTELAATPGNSLTSIALSGNGRILVAAERPLPSKATINMIYLWNSQTLKPLTPLTRPATLRGDDTRYAVLSPDAKTLAWSSFRSGFTFFDLKTKHSLWTKTKVSAQDVAFSPDGKLAALEYVPIGVYQNGLIGVYQARTGKMVTSWTLHPAAGEGFCCFSSKGRYFASVGARPVWEQWVKARNDSGGEIELRRTSDWQVERVFHINNAKKIAFSPDESKVLGLAPLFTSNFGSFGSVLRCFDVTTGRVLWELDSRSKGAEPQLRFLNDACFSPDGSTLAVFANNRQVFLLDANTREIKRTLRVSAAQESTCNFPHALAFSPDGKRLFARGNSAVLVWDLD